MIQPEDLSRFKDKETFLHGIRDARSAREREYYESDGGAPSFSEALRRAVPDMESRQGGTEEEGGRTASTVYGTDTSSTNGTGRSGGSGVEFRPDTSQLAGGGSSVDQPSRPASKRFSLRDTASRYRHALTPEKKEPDKKKGAAAGGKTISDAEGAKLRPKLLEYVLWQSEHLDQFIIATTRGHDPSIEIWSNLSRDEAEILVDFLIAMAKTDVKIAHAVRVASTVIDRLKLGVIIAPRVYRTLMVYAERGISIR